MIPPPTADDLAHEADKHWSEMHKLMAFGRETSIAASVACLWISRAAHAERELAEDKEYIKDSGDRFVAVVRQRDAAEKALAELAEDFRRHRAKDI